MTKKKPPPEKPRPKTDDAELALAEASALLGFGGDPSKLCGADRVRVGMVAGLMAAVDAATESLLAGNSSAGDIGRLTSTVDALIRLLPKAMEPVQSRPDPREQMWQTYKAMRARGAAAGQGYDGLVLENERLRAEVAELKDLAGETSEHPDVPVMVERVPAAGGNVVPMPRPNPPAVPAYDYNTQRGWRDHVLPDGSIRTEHDRGT
jgi:hypothetical protein